MFNEKEIQLLYNWNIILHKKQHIKNQHTKNILSEREIWLKENPCPIECKIKKLYKEGYGYKTLAKKLNMTYSTFRKLCNDYIKFETRQGTNVITDKLRETRRNNVLGEKSPFYDWPRKKPQLCLKNGRSIQGFYKKKDNTKVWLRSTYEYIIAKWLDKMNLDWKVEIISYKLSNGENYRPDFFIFEKNKLKNIIEVKSRFFNKDNREYKFHLLKKEYDIEAMLITDISNFTDKTYHQELREWKKIRSLEN